MNKLEMNEPHSKQKSLGPSLFAIAAALLVFNSHLETLYPRPYLAGDGLLGNSMFFFLSGWGLATSWRNAPISAWTYAWRRISRIYPSLVLAILILSWLPERGWQSWSVPEHLFEFVYPTHFTYINVIIPAYVLIYPLLLLNRPKLYPFLIMGAALIYSVAYLIRRDYLDHPHLSLGRVPGEFHYSFYAAVILGGMWRGSSSPPANSIKSPILVSLETLGLVASYLSLKVLMAVSVGWKLFPLLHLLCFLSLSPLFSTLNLLGEVVSARKLRQFVSFAGTLTLEIYVTHLLLLKRPEAMSLLPSFPLNIPIFLVVTICISIAIQYLASVIIQVIEPVTRSTGFLKMRNSS